MPHKSKKPAPRPTASPGSQAPQKKKNLTGLKLWAFRLGTLVLVPGLLLCCLELGLRWAGYGYPTSFFLKQQIGGRAFLVENDKFGWRFFGPARARTPRPMEIPASKPPMTCRVFVFGESAAYGDPKPEYGLPRFLEVLLRERFPGVDFEVINAAMTGINSHVILPIARDCARQHGDVWVLYMGNNEVVGPFGSGTVFGRQAPSLPLIRGNLLLKTTRIGELLQQLATRGANASASDPEWEGMAMFLNNQVAHDDPRMERVYTHFQRNLEDIVHLGQRHGVRVVVSTVVSNLKDCAPFGSQHRAGLDAAQRTRWEALYSSAINAAAAGQNAEAIEGFHNAAAIDDQYAELQFRWAQCCLAAGNQEEAGAHFRLARDYDTLRFRADTRINQIIRATVRGQEPRGTWLAEAEAELGKQSPSGLTGHELLYEHVHLNFEGNYALARAIGEQLLHALPDFVKARETADRQWASLAECARRLAWTGWDRCRTLQSVLWRLDDPPFTSQFNHSEYYDQLRKELEQLLPEQKPPGLRRALEGYQQAIALAPNDWVLQRNLVDLLRKNNDLPGAEAAAKKAIELLPHDWMNHFEFGLLLLQAHRAEEASAQFQQVLAADPGSIPALNGAALALTQAGRKSEAIDQLQAALKLKPKSAETHLNLAATLELEGNKEQAREQVRLAMEDRFDTPELLVRAGRACMVQGWVDLAITNFQKALSFNPTDATVHWYLGGALDTKGLGSEAQRHFAEAVRLDPELPGGHLGLGIELSRQGKYDEATNEFQTALRLNPALVEARLRLGIALLRQHQPAEARAQFEQVLAQQPGNTTAQKYLLMLAKP